MATNYKLFDLLKAMITRVTPIKYGGTGATTVAGILDNLGIKDYVVDYGTSGVWTWRKWASGSGECWIESPFSETWDDASGALMGGYYAQKINPSWGRFPFTFITTPSAGGDARLGSGTGFVMVTCTVSGLGYLSCTGNQNTTTVNDICIQVKGRWK